jgi:hypothetical protein
MDLFGSNDTYTRSTISQSLIKRHTSGYVKMLGPESKGIILSRQHQMDRKLKIHTVSKKLINDKHKYYLTTLVQ